MKEIKLWDYKIRELGGADGKFNVAKPSDLDGLELPGKNIFLDTYRHEYITFIML